MTTTTNLTTAALTVSRTLPMSPVELTWRDRIVIDAAAAASRHNSIVARAAVAGTFGNAPVFGTAPAVGNALAGHGVYTAKQAAPPRGNPR